MNGADSVVIIHDDQAQGTLSPEAVATATAAGDVVIDGGNSGLALPVGWPSNAALQPDGTVILTLDYPVRFKLRDPSTGEIRPGDAYERLHLHRLKGKHKITLMNVGDDRVKFEKALMVCSTGLDSGKVDLLYGEMDQSDLAAVVRVTNFFMTPGRKTGPAS